MVDCANCCGAAKNWLLYGFKHHTLHMVSDLKEGDILFVGNLNRKYRITEITVPFKNIVGTVLTASALNVTENETASLEFIKKHSGNVVIKITEEIRDWGIRGHSRNKHKPEPRKMDVSSLL